MMKFCMSAIMAMFIGFASCAADDVGEPIDSGVWSLSGGATYSKISDNGIDCSVISVTPGIYYFMWDNVALGGVANYSRISYDSYNATNYGIGPACKIYFGSGQNVYPFLAASIVYYKSDTDKETIRNDIEKNEVSLGCGLDIMLAKNVALEPFVAYHMITDGSSIDFDDADETQLIVGLGISTFIF